MQVFYVKTMVSYPYAEREKNMLYQTREFKARIIELSPEGKMPTCEMTSYVMFYVLTGKAEIEVNLEKVTITEGQCLITEPATLSMRTQDGVKIMGIQVTKK